MGSTQHLGRLTVQKHLCVPLRDVVLLIQRPGFLYTMIFKREWSEPYLNTTEARSEVLFSIARWRELPQLVLPVHTAGSLSAGELSCTMLCFMMAGPDPQ